MPNNQPNRPWHAGPRRDRLDRLIILLLKILTLGILAELLPSCAEYGQPDRSPSRPDRVRIIENSWGYALVPTCMIERIRAPRVVGSAAYHRTTELTHGWIFPTIRRESRSLEIDFWDGRGHTPSEEAKLRRAYARIWRSTVPVDTRVLEDLEGGDGFRTRWLWWGTLANGAILRLLPCVVIPLVTCFYQAARFRAEHPVWTASHRLILFYQGLCPNCRYNIRYATRPQCPECGLRWWPQEAPLKFSLPLPFAGYRAPWQESRPPLVAPACASPPATCVTSSSVSGGSAEPPWIDQASVDHRAGEQSIP